MNVSADLNLETETTDTPPDRVKIREKNPFLAALLSWMIPGLGHLYLSRPWKGLMLFVAIIGSAVMGGIMFDFHIISPTFKLHFVAQTGLGLPALIMAWFNQGLSPDKINGIMIHRNYEIAMLYTDVAGLLNYLVAIHALLIADMAVYGKMTPATESQQVPTPEEPVL